MYHALLFSSRTEMAGWVKDINAQFLTQVALTVDRLNGVEMADQDNNCLTRVRNVAGNEIQEIVSEVISDLQLIHRDYVFLLQDSIDFFVSFNQIAAMAQLLMIDVNVITRIDIVLYLAEGILYEFYKEMFEVQIEELLIEMETFNDLVNETRTRAFIALRNITEQTETYLRNC